MGRGDDAYDTLDDRFVIKRSRKAHLPGDRSRPEPARKALLKRRSLLPLELPRACVSEPFQAVRLDAAPRTRGETQPVDHRERPGVPQQLRGLLDGEPEAVGERDQIPCNGRLAESLKARAVAGEVCAGKCSSKELVV